MLLFNEIFESEDLTSESITRLKKRVNNVKAPSFHSLDVFHKISFRIFSVFYFCSCDLFQIAHCLFQRDQQFVANLLQQYITQSCSMSFPFIFAQQSNDRIVTKYDQPYKINIFIHHKKKYVITQLMMCNVYIHFRSGYLFCFKNFVRRTYSGHKSSISCMWGVENVHNNRTYVGVRSIRVRRYQDNIETKKDQTKGEENVYIA